MSGTQLTAAMMLRRLELAGALNPAREISQSERRAWRQRSVDREPPQSLQEAAGRVQQHEFDTAALSYIREAYDALGPETSAAEADPEAEARVRQDIAARIAETIGGLNSRSNVLAKLSALPMAALDQIERRLTAGTLSPLFIEAAVDNMIRRDGAALAGDLAPVAPAYDCSVSALGPVDLSGLDDQMEPPPTPYGQGLFYEKGVTLLIGPSGCGKTMLVCAACVSTGLDDISGTIATKSPPSAVYIDLDNNDPNAMLGRLLAMGASRKDLEMRNIQVIRPAQVSADNRAQYPDTQAATEGIVSGLLADPRRLVVFDSFAFLCAAMKADENSAADIGRVFALVEVLRTVSQVVFIDHTGHDAASRARGSSAKAAAADAVITMDSWTPKNAEDGVLFGGILRSPKDRHAGLWTRLCAPDDTEKARTLGCVLFKRATLGTLKGPKRGRVTMTLIPARATAEKKSRERAEAEKAGTTPEQRRAAVLLDAVAVASETGIATGKLIKILTDTVDADLRLSRDRAREAVAAVIAAETAAGRWREEKAGRARLIRRVEVPEPAAETA